MVDRSALPPPRSFYQHELGELRRTDRKGWAAPKSGCPFHASESKHSFHVNLDHGGFHCFGCDARGGDVIAFTMLRYKLDFKAALKHLNVDDCGNRPWKPRPKLIDPPMSLDQMLARKLALAVEYGMEMPPDGY